jgi:osmotically inducible lipoprotein OsmB
MKRLLVGLALAAALVSTAGCAGMSPQGQRTASGAAIGAAGGAGIGLLTGAPVAGALIGGAAGAGVGALCCNGHR